MWRRCAGTEKDERTGECSGCCCGTPVAWACACACACVCVCVWECVCVWPCEWNWNGWCEGYCLAMALRGDTSGPGAAAVAGRGCAWGRCC